MKVYHQITDLHFDGDMMHITIDGQKKNFNLPGISSLLCRASEQERQTFEISPSGYGIHWPLLDEDLSIDGLLGIIHTPEEKAGISKTDD